LYKIGDGNNVQAGAAPFDRLRMRGLLKAASSSLTLSLSKGGNERDLKTSSLSREISRSSAHLI
jgi:hypothetical protein